MVGSETLGIIGLGYVGLPLAVEFGRVRKTIGFDIDDGRIQELKESYDRTRETEPSELLDARQLIFTSDVEMLSQVDVFIVAVPTPIDISKRPNFQPLVNASQLVGRHMKSGAVVIYESTVYPGATEQICVPVLEENSGLKFNVDFTIGYSPERINPGDKNHRLTTIKKITSGSNAETALFVDKLYQSIITAGTHLASSIQVAEAAKVIENVQRDVNIALINELAVLFAKLGIDTHEVLEAAGSKWNFLKFTPGLVGGHCIGVDPYYLTHRAQEVGHYPDVILAGRRINDSMGSYVADRVVLLMTRKGLNIKKARVLLLGITFKENCPDVRNTKVIDVYRQLNAYGLQVEVFDPHAYGDDVIRDLNIELTSRDQVIQGGYSAVVLAVAHDEFRELAKSLPEILTEGGVVYDIKAFLPIDVVDERL